jgi:nucleoside permease NupC
MDNGRILGCVSFCRFEQKKATLQFSVQWLTEKFGWMLSCTVGTTPCESLNAASNIFLGLAMAPLLIKPYVKKLTRSEIHTGKKI